MNEDFVRQVDKLQQEIDGLVKPEISMDLISPFLDLPGLVGFWPMSSVQRSTGNAYDLSGQGRTLTYNGNPTYNIYNSIIPYIDLDGTGDFLSRPDETDLDILGTETIYASGVRGLTLGGWYWFDDNTPAAVEYMISKFGGGGQRSFALTRRTDQVARMLLSTDGTALVQVDSTVALDDGAWYFYVGRFEPSTELAVFVNGVKTTNATAIPASIFNSTASFEIGAQGGGGSLQNGRSSLDFLCANNLPDALINSLFQSTRGAFGV